jgi:hypothetical protein
MPTPSAYTRELAIEEKRALELHRQPTELRRCLKCDHWMHSTGADHRICNPCKGDPFVRGIAGRRVKP